MAPPPLPPKFYATKRKTTETLKKIKFFKIPKFVFF